MPDRPERAIPPPPGAVGADDSAVGGGRRTVASMNETTTITRPIPRATVHAALPTEMLERFRARAREHDRDNTYVADDLAELRSFGYLGAAAPAHHGGWGLTLADMAVSQRRLARYAPATALAMSMHT